MSQKIKKSSHCNWKEPTSVMPNA